MQPQKSKLWTLKPLLLHTKNKVLMSDRKSKRLTQKPTKIPFPEKGNIIAVLYLLKT